EGGQGLHGGGASADLGEEDGDLEDAEAVRGGHVEQAGAGEFLPGIVAPVVDGTEHLGGQVRDRLRSFGQGEVHDRGRPRWRSATRVSRIWVVSVPGCSCVIAIGKVCSRPYSQN